MRFTHILLFIGTVALGAVGCDNEPADEQQAKPEPDHIWKGQTQALETARDVAKDVESQQSAMDERLKGVTGNNQ